MFRVLLKQLVDTILITNKCTLKDLLNYIWHVTFIGFLDFGFNIFRCSLCMLSDNFNFGTFYNDAPQNDIL